MFKFIAAAIIPGGFILWGLHELSRYRKNNKEVSSDSSETKY